MYLEKVVSLNRLKWMVSLFLVSSRSEIVGKAEDRAGNLSKKPFAMSGTETRELRAIMNTGYQCPPQ